MKFKRLICLFISVLMIVGAFSIQAYASENSTDKIDMNADFAEDRVLVKLAANSYTRSMGKITKDSFDILCSDIRLLNPSVTVVSKVKGEYSAYAITDTQNNVFVLTLKESGKDKVAQAIRTLNANPAVEIAEPDYIGQYTATPNDMYYSNQYALQLIDAETAWDYTRGNETVVVGILDSGIEGTHPDLYDNLWINPNPNQYGYINDVHGYNFDEHFGGSPSDGYGHGTHVAGIIGATGNNEIGVCGINWNVSLAWLGVGTSGPSTSAVVEALNYANLHDILITNNSYSLGDSAILKESIETYRGLYIVAAGNSWTDIDSYPSYPASYDLPNILTVASTDENDELSYFSNYGIESVDIAAPGSGIYSTYLNSSYDYMSGTSMATPQVVGVAALLKSEYPNLSTAQIKAAILNGVDVLDCLNGKVATSGRLNAYKALQSVGTSLDVYFQNTSNWNNIKAYYWSTNGSNPVSWPGTEMTQVSGNIYKVTIPSDCNRIIFSNNGSNQTANLIVQGNNYLYIPTADTWIAYNPDDLVTIYYQNDFNWANLKAYYWEDNGYFYPVNWPGENMEHVRANIYSIVVPSRCDKIIFSNNGSNQTLDLSIPGNGKIYRPSTGTWENYNPFSDSTITLYFTNNNNWSNVKAYLWNNPLNTNNTWPGEAMVYVGLNQYNQQIYSITFDSSQYNRVIFNGSGGQTVQITAGSDGTGYYLTGSQTGGNWNVSTYNYWE